MKNSRHSEGQRSFRERRGVRWTPLSHAGHGAFRTTAVTMPGLAELLAPHEDRPVIDMTGLTGLYHIQFTVDPPPPGPSHGDPLGEELFRTLDKSGLKLEKRTAPVATIVVDHIQKTPTEN